MTTTVKRYNQSVAAAIMQPSDNVSAKGKVISNPTSSEDATIFFTDTEISIHAMQAVLVGSASPSVTWTVRYAADRSAAGTEVVTGGTTTTGTTSGSAVTTLNNATIPADNFVWLETTAKSGTVAELGVTLIFGTAAAAPGGGGGSYATVSWTDIPATDPSDRDIYVSASTGSDAHVWGYDWGGGQLQGSISRPFASLGAAIAALRTGHGDRLWCKCGDTFSVTTEFHNWNLSGQSSANRMIFGSYGAGARPIIDSGSGSFFTENPSFASGPAHLMFLDLEITASGYSGGGGVSAFACYSGSTAGVNDILVEGCDIHNFTNCFVTVSSQDDYDSPYFGFAPDRHTNVQFRGTIIREMYRTGTADLTSMYYAGLDGLLIEWCLFDKACTLAQDNYNALSHNLYVHNNTTGVVFRYNVIVRGFDTQIRPGGDVHDNVIWHCTSGFEFGGGTYPAVQTATGALEDNALLSLGNDSSGSILSYGIYLGNLNAASIKRNYMVGCNATSPISFWCRSSVYATAPVSLAVTNSSVEDNRVYNFGGAGLISQDGTVGVDWLGNTFKRNHFQCPDNATEWWLTSGYHVIGFKAGTNSTIWECENNRIRAYAPGAYPSPGQEFDLLNNGTGWGGGPLSIGTTGDDDWFDTFGDSTTTSAAVTYANPTRATFGSFWVDVLGETTLGSESADADAVIEVLRSQRKGSWNDLATAHVFRLRIAECMEEV